MIGSRIPDVRRDRRRGWGKWDRIERRRGGHHRRRQVAPPGAYMKVLNEDGSTWCWYIRAPDGDVATIRFEHHQVAELEDGTITVTPSIVMPHGNRWHGWLRAGEWTSV